MTVKILEKSGKNISVEKSPISMKIAKSTSSYDFCYHFDPKYIFRSGSNQGRIELEKNGDVDKGHHL